MDSSLKVFLIGMVVGMSALFLSGLGDDEGFLKNPQNLFLKILSVSATTWVFVFLIIVITTLPVMAIDPLKKRFTRKQYLPFPFLAGNGFAFLFLQAIAMILQALHFF